MANKMGKMEDVSLPSQEHHSCVMSEPCPIQILSNLHSLESDPFQVDPLASCTGILEVPEQDGIDWVMPLGGASPQQLTHSLQAGIHDDFATCRSPLVQHLS